MIKGILKWMIGTLLAFVLMFFLVFIVIAVMADDEPVVKDNSYLYISLSGSVSEYQAPDPFAEAFGQTELDMKEVRDVLEKAAVDDRVNGVVLKLEYLQVGYGKIQELRQLIKHFQESGKPIFAYLGPDLAFTKDYYVASACDSVFMPASTNLFLNGIGGEITFYKDFFKKFGIEAEFVQIGKYKNAPDVYTRSSISGPHREVLENILSIRYEHLINTIAESRGLTPKQVKNLMENISGFTGREAIKHNLIDRTCYIDDFTQQLSKNQSKPKKLSASEYASVPASSLKIRNKSRIAVINCVGTIAGGSDTDDPYFGKIMGAQTVISNLEKASRSKSIKAIILRIDSPGGSATASEAIWQAIKKAREHKPVIASISDYGASGGYYIAMAADTMLASPNSLVGSIGIYAGKFNIKGLYEKLDLHNQVIPMGKNGGLFSINEPWSPSERAIIERLITDFYNDFITKTAESRNLEVEQVDQLGRGHVWTGTEAVENQLFDGTGFFYDAVDAAVEMAGINSDESVRLVYYPKEKSMFDQLFNTYSIFSYNRNPVQELEGILKSIQNRPLALMPFRIDEN